MADRDEAFDSLINEEEDSSPTTIEFDAPAVDVPGSTEYTDGKAVGSRTSVGGEGTVGIDTFTSVGVDPPASVGSEGTVGVKTPDTAPLFSVPFGATATAPAASGTQASSPFLFGSTIVPPVFPTAADGGTRATFGRSFTFGTDMATATNSTPTPTATFPTAAGGASTFEFGVNTGAEFTPKPWIPDPFYYRDAPGEVPLEGIHFNIAPVNVAVSPSATPGFGKKRRRCADDDGRPSEKRMR